MGTIKQGILGGFSGSVANVVGSSWKGIAVLKSKPLSVANPNTSAQQSQRTSFKSISKLASSILTYVCQPVYNVLAQYMSGYNLFCKQNKLAFDGNGDFDPTACYIGGGKLENVTDLAAGAVLSSGNFNISFTKGQTGGGAASTDLMKGFAFEPTTESVWAVTSRTERGTELVEFSSITDNSDLLGQLQVYVFLSCVSADGKNVGVKQLGTAIDITFVE